ncbi:accessory gene regulator B family protein [Clostridium saudiense]|nr:accessory gene regulator B family protein [Clostridium saudiense]MBM6861372.1 accessory gene regulator B family protein [Clostridium saudiense]
MMEKVIKKFVSSIAIYNNYTDEQKEEVEYTLKIIIYELIKILAIIIIFHLMGYLEESLMILFVMSVTKPFIGGYHEDSQIKCFIATGVLVAIIIQLSVASNINFISGILLNIISMFTVYNKAPIINEKMPITREDLIEKNRAKGIRNTCILAIGSLAFFYLTPLSQVVIWTILIQCILMFNKKEYKAKNII